MPQPIFYVHLMALVITLILAYAQSSRPLFIVAIGFFLFLIPDIFIRDYSYFTWYVVIDGSMALIAAANSVHRFVVTGYILSFTVALIIALQPHSGWFFHSYERLMGCCLGFYFVGILCMIKWPEVRRFS